MCSMFMSLMVVYEYTTAHPPAGGITRNKLVKEFVEKCYEPGGNFQENKACVGFLVLVLVQFCIATD